MATDTVGLAAAPAVADPAPGVLRRAWEGWKKFAHAFGVFQTRLVMWVLYFVVILPVGVVVRLVSDPLRLRPPKDTNWVPLPSEPHSLDSARQQF